MDQKLIRDSGWSARMRWPKPGGGVHHLEVIVAGFVAETGEGRGDAFAFP